MSIILLNLDLPVKESSIQITRRATAAALLECAEIMETKKLTYYEVFKKLKENNIYWLSNDSFRLMRYAGEQTMPYASLEHQIDMVLLVREHILQTGLLDFLGRNITE
jgi:hypothetical protein